MRIVSWNCGGWTLGGFNAQKMQVMREYKPDILIVQECTKTDFDVLKPLWRHKSWYGDDQEVSNQGLAVFSHGFSLGFTVEFNRNFRFVVPYCLKDETGKIAPFTLFAVWTKDYIKGQEKENYKYQDNLLKALAYYQDKSFDGIGKKVVIGDFNTGSNKKNQTEYKKLEDFLGSDSIKLFNCAKANTKDKDTFYSKTRHEFYQDDFCFASETWACSPITKVTIADADEWKKSDSWAFLWNDISDHCPIIVDLDF